MRMLFYYFIHSGWNQLKRLIRTWAFLLLIVIATIGGLAVYAVNWYYQRLSSVEGLLPEDVMEFFEVENMTGLDAVELFAGILILSILVIQAISAEKSVSRLFMQADVNLLFTSPLSPQMVLLFRLMTTLGMAFAAFLVLLFQIPSLMRRFRLTFYAALSIPLAWLFLLAFSVLLKALIYEIGSRHPFFRKNLRWFILGGVGVLGIVFYSGYEEKLLVSLHRFFSGKYGIPVWGWLKGFLMFALKGDVARSLFYLCICAALICFMVFLSIRLPADYYEDTLTRTQEIALLIESYKQDGIRSVAAWLTRSDKRRNRGGFHYGHGSSVYFFKVLYNRQSLFFTRTGITYLLAALAAGWFDRTFLDKPVLYIPVLLLAVMVFFRTIFSPVTEDIQRASFLLQPDPIWSKLFFSILGGSCNCALDVVLPLMLGSWVAGFSPLMGLLFLPVLIGVDFFAAAAGAFVDVSLPRSIGTTFRQVIQILLLYVGLIFDGLILTSGITGGFLGAGFFLVTVVNGVFGAFFLGLTGVWLYPSSGRIVRPGPDEKTVTEGRKAYSRSGFALMGMYLAIFVCQRLFSWLSLLISGNSPLSSGLSSLFAVYAPVYLIGFSVFALIFRPRRESTSKGDRLKAYHFLLLIPACLFAVYSGNIIGSLLAGLLHVIVPHPLLPAVELSAGYPVLQVFFLVVLSPLMEEIIFRRCLIERVLPYGAGTAVLTSALLFGLSHGTANQLCYGFMLGLILGYVYVKTRRLRYTVFLHMLINALSSVVLPALLTRVTGNASFTTMRSLPVARALQQPGVLALLLYLFLLFALSLFGAVVFLFGLREKPLPKEGIRMKDALGALGTVMFIATTCLGIILTA